MSDPVSALDGASFDGIVRIADAGLQGMITVRGDLTSPGVAAAVSQAVGVSVPKKSCVETDGARGSARGRDLVDHGVGPILIPTKVDGNGKFATGESKCDGAADPLASTGYKNGPGFCVGNAHGDFRRRNASASEGR